MQFLHFVKEPFNVNAGEPRAGGQVLKTQGCPVGMLDDCVARRYDFRAVTTYPERGGVIYCLRFESLFIRDTSASGTFLKPAKSFCWFSIFAVSNCWNNTRATTVVVFPRRML